MIAFIDERKLSDCSSVYNVCVREGGDIKCTFYCVDESCAYLLLGMIVNNTTNVTEI